MKYSLLEIYLKESKFDIVRDKNPELKQQIDFLEKEKLKPKYLDWSVKQLLTGSKLEDLIPTLKYFDTNQNRFKEKDINKYTSLKELEDLVKETGKSKTQEKKETKLISIVAGSLLLFSSIVDTALAETIVARLIVDEGSSPANCRFPLLATAQKSYRFRTTAPVTTWRSPSSTS